jgi:hypothetical protein
MLKAIDAKGPAGGSSADALRLRLDLMLHLLLEIRNNLRGY